MPFQVVRDGPPRERASAVGGWVLEAIGAVLVIGGDIVMMPAVVLALVLLIEWILWLGNVDMLPASVEDTVRFGCLVSFVVAAIAVTVGNALTQRRRRLVLFLRRFGHTEATHALTMAAARIGGHWRLVTLDDARIAAIGAPSGVRGFVGAVDRTKAGLGKVTPVATKVWQAVMSGLAAAAAIAAGFALFSEKTWPARADRVESLVDFTHPPHDVAGSLFQIFAYVMLAGLLLAAIAFALVIVGWTSVLPFVAVYGQVEDSVHDAERHKVIAVADEPALGRAMGRVKVQGKRVLSARLTVLKVETPVWRQTVHGMASISAVPLIDVSDPTENILWEIQELLRQFGRRCVFVGQLHRLEALRVRAPLGSVVSRVQTLLDGHRVLAYTGDGSDSRRFATALRNTLEFHVDQPLPGPVPGVPTVRRR